jgi:hypothetical protein
MKRKRIEFSKIIFIGVSTITIAVVVFSFLMIYKTGDLSPPLSPTVLHLLRENQLSHL